MSQERIAIASQKPQISEIVRYGSLEQVKNISTHVLLNTYRRMKESMLELSISNKANPDVFIYLYNDVFKPRSPNMKRRDGDPMVMTAACLTNASVLIFLAEKGADLRPKTHNNYTVFNWINDPKHELLYEQLLVIEAKHKPELMQLHARNMSMIGRPQQAKKPGSSSVLDYISSFWATTPTANLQPADIREILITKSLREVKKLSPTILLDVKGGYDATALHLALRNISHPDVFAYLYNDVFKMSSPHYQKKDGISLIVFAACYNNRQAIKFLVEHGANLQDTDPYGKTALQIIATCEPEFAQSLPQLAIDNDNSKLTVSGPQATSNVRKRNTQKDNDTIDCDDDLRSPLLGKMSPSGSLCE